jgi:hypothetical protein
LWSEQLRSAVVSRKAKTRLFVVANGVEREVLVARDRHADGIVFTAGHSKYFLGPEDQRIVIIEQHYSVHPANGGRDLVVTQKTKLENGDDISIASFVKGNVYHPLLFPIYGRRLPNFVESPPLRHNARDRIFQIGAYDTASANLIYSVFVTERDTPIKTGAYGPNTFAIVFERYKLVVLTGYLNLPSINEGDISLSITSPPVTNGVRAPGIVQQPSGPLPRSRINEVHLKHTGGLIDRFRRRLIEQGFYDDRDISAEFQASMLRGITLVPIVGKKVDATADLSKMKSSTRRLRDDCY